jgi:dephospho-CoA kinase
MIVLGLTGSIGMGKSTTAALFRSFGIRVFDADRCVHQLYSGEAYASMKNRFPEAVVDEGIDREILRRSVIGNPNAILDLEKIIHPMVAAKRHEFLEKESNTGSVICVIDVPLLFETDVWREVDAIIVVSAPAAVQFDRVLSRPGMDQEKFGALLGRQVPDEQKR